MKFSLNHIRWYGYDQAVAKPTDELTKIIGAQLGEIEEVTVLGQKYEHIIVVKVVSCVKHPNADKLNVCKIDDGGIAQDVERDDQGLVQVVCGAPNCREGLTVAWLPPGSIVPSTFDKEKFTLEARDLRGEVSNGMLASPAELGMSDNHEGILEIDAEEVGDNNTKPGTPFKQLYGLDDIIIDIENKMFTHRPDCFGMLGVARELAGIQDQAFTSPDWYLEPIQLTSQQDSAVKGLTVRVEIPELVPRYQALVMSDVKVGPSPVWLQTFLTRLGVKSINNIVDMTNYVMLTTGQPLHAFDFDKVAVDGTAQIVVRKPKPGEKMSLLDGKTIEPHAEAVLICDQDKPIALGGVMGGNNSEIDDQTTRIIIESANFNMYNIRKTSMAHGLFTDAVTRFNKGQSPWQTEAVLHKAVEMTTEVSPGARLVTEPVDVKAQLPTNLPVTVDARFINDRLGVVLKTEEIKRSLENVEFQVTLQGDQLEVTAPFWRTDIAIPEDIVEEVGRLYGYDRLALNLPQRDLTPPQPDELFAFKQLLRQTLAKGGANEVLTYSFVHGKLLEQVGQDPTLAFRLNNALSPDLQYFRMSLLPSLLDKVHANLKSGYDQFALFEMNKSHSKLHADDDEGLPNETSSLALVYAADDKLRKLGAAYYEARKYLDYLSQSIGVDLYYEPLEKQDEQAYKPFDLNRSAIVKVKGTDVVLGIVGEFKATVRKALKLPVHSSGFEVDINKLMQNTNATMYQPLSRFPKVNQDISLKVPAETPYSAVYDLIEATIDSHNGTQVIEQTSMTLEPVDIYQGEDTTSKHITIRLTITNHERTMTDTEVAGLLDEVAKRAQTELLAERL